MGAIWEADRHQPERGKKKPKDKLPIIYPMIFYNGRVSPYPFPVDFFQLFSQPELAKTVLTSPFHLVDLTVIPDEELLKHGYVAALEMFQKHAFQVSVLFQHDAHAALSLVYCACDERMVINSASEGIE